MKKTLSILLIWSLFSLSFVFAKTNLEWEWLKLYKTIIKKLDKKIDKKQSDQKYKYIKKLVSKIDKIQELTKNKTNLQNKHLYLLPVFKSLDKNYSIELANLVEFTNEEKTIIEKLNNPGLPDFKFFYQDKIQKKIPWLLEKLIKLNKSEFYKIIATDYKNVTEDTFDFVDNKLSYIQGIYSHKSSVDQDNKINKLIEKINNLLIPFNNEIWYNKKLYDMYVYCLNNCELDNDTKRAFEKTIKDYKDSGIDLPEKKQDRLNEISLKLSKYQNDFTSNIIKDLSEIVFYIDDVEKIKDMPEDKIERARKLAEKEGKKWYKFPWNFSSYGDLLTYCSDRDIRQKVYTAYRTIASKWKYDNNQNVLNILKLKQEKAKILWYDNYADFSLSKKMAENPQEVIDLEDQIAQIVNKKSDKEVEMLKKYFDINNFNVWDISYYIRLYKKAELNFDTDKLRKYFEFDTVMGWLFEAMNKVYWIQIKEVEYDTYNQDVMAYKVYKDWKMKGYIIMDLFQRKTKNSGAWANSFRNLLIEKDKTTYPIMIIVSSIIKWEKNTLLTHWGVTTLFHEFGHAIHNLLSSSKYSNLSGFWTEWDFAELPSQLNENWAKWKWLKHFAKDYKTWKTIPDNIIKKMEQSKKVFAGLSKTYQLFLSRLDMLLYLEDTPKNVEKLKKKHQKILKENYYFPNIENTYYNQFAHIFDGWYAAGYYSYLRSALLEKDILSLFKEKWLYNKEIWKKYYNTVLSQWARKPGKELFKDMMWRDVDINSYLESEGLKE